MNTVDYSTHQRMCYQNFCNRYGETPVKIDKLYSTVQYNIKTFKYRF